MFQYLILAIVTIVLISLIYWVCISRGDKARRKKSEQALNESAGVFDQHARRALDELTQIQDPQPDDFFRRGNIFQYNLLEGNTRGTRGENRIARRQRQTAVGNIIRDYTDTLLGMQGRVADIGIDRDLGPDFMVHRIEDININLLGGFDDDLEIQRILAGFDNIVTTQVPAVRREIVQERRAQAIATANNRAEAIDNYFDAATKYTNDAQNVHDSKVNGDLRNTLQRLKRTAPADLNPMQCIDECLEYIEDEYSHEHGEKVRDAVSILNKISEGNPIGTFGEREDNIFALVWTRCSHSANRSNKDLMREAVVNALADSVEGGNQVCINGRCARVLNSLVTLDFDKSVSEGAMTFEAYKNQIFQETKELINQELDRALASTDDKLRAVGEAYEGTDVEVDSAVEERFKQEIKQEIDRNMEKYEAKLTPAEINNLKQECYVYATL
jgi:hypothetical protein